MRSNSMMCTLSKPSDFEIYFRTKGQEFRYTLSFDAEDNI